MSTYFFSVFLLVAGIIKLIVSFKQKDLSGKMFAYKTMAWSLFPLFLMMGIWGLVSFLSANIGIGIGC